MDVKKSVWYRDLLVVFGGAFLFFIVLYVSLLNLVNGALLSNLLSQLLETETKSVVQFSELYLEGEISRSEYEEACIATVDKGNIVFILDKNGKTLCSNNNSKEALILEEVDTNLGVFFEDVSNITTKDNIEYLCSIVEVKSTDGTRSCSIFICSEKNKDLSIIDKVSGIIITTTLLAALFMFIFFIYEVRYIADLREKNAVESMELEERDKILESISDALISVDDKGMVRHMNTRAKELGIADEEHSKVTDTHILEGMKEAQINGERVVFKQKIDDRVYAVITESYKDSQEGNGVVVVLRDITENEQTENMRNAFVSNVSHELRTPLTVIRGFAQKLEEDRSGMDDEKKKRYYRSMIVEVDRLSSLVTDMLMLSKLDSGITKIETEVLDIAYCSQAFSAYLSTMCADKRINTQVCVPEQALARFSYDKFRQILIILCENARKFTPEGGSIEVHIVDGSEIVELIGDRDLHISTRKMRIQDMTNRYFVYVEDSGCGIDRESLTHIFERFYTIDKSHNSGTGLGLALANEILKSVGECMVAASSKNSSTIVGFTLIKATEQEIEEEDSLEDVEE